MLACRNCRVPLSAVVGCTLCNPVRKHLVVMGETDEERPSLSATGGEIVAGLRGQLRVIREALKRDPDNEGAEARLIRLGNTASKVLEAARKLQADGVQAVENMSFVERAELFIGWIQELAPAYRTALRERWDEWEAAVSKPLASRDVELALAPHKAKD